jgi:hypothetical protein
VRKFSDNDEALFDCVKVRVQRSLPKTSIMSENRHIITILKRAIEEHGIEAERSNKFPGLEEVFKLGWLQAVAMHDELTLYSFPSLLHHR